MPRMTDTPFDTAMSLSKQELARRLVEAEQMLGEFREAMTAKFKQMDVQIEALRSIARKGPATCDMTLAHEMAQEAEDALGINGAVGKPHDPA